MSELTNKTVAWSSGPTVTLNYRYDTFGSVTDIWSSTAGVTNTYQFDILGRLTTVKAGGTTAAAYGYDLLGNLQTMQYGNGVTNLYQYDSMNRLTNLVWKAGNTSLASFAYTLGPTGNRTALAEMVNGTARSYTWNDDYLYRLNSETIQNIGTLNYNYDAVGNRTNRISTVTGIANQSPTYNTNDWLNSDSYDNNGNTICYALF